MGLWLGSGYRLWGGFDSGCSFLAARLNRLVFPKLVEPTRERQRVGRVETVVGVSGVLGVGFVVRVPGVSTQPFASLTRWLNQLGKWVPRRWGMAG